MDFDPFTPEAIENPYPAYARLRASEPVGWHERMRTWLVFKHADVRDVFTNDDDLTVDRSRATKYRRPKVEKSQRTRNIQALDPPDHTPIRQILTRSLTPRVRAFGPEVDAVIDALLRSTDRAIERAVGEIDASRTFDLIDEFAYPLPITVIAELFGVPDEDRAKFQSWSHDIARSMDRFYGGDGAAAAFEASNDYFRGLVAERRAEPGDDVISALIAAEAKGERLTDREVVSMATTLVFAGHETTVNLIGNGMLALLRNREQFERVRDGDVTAESAVEELLRYDPPAQLISRVACRDHDMHGHRIAAGETVAAVIGSANRDPALFENPDALDVGRTDNDHITFGLGTHFCPGAGLTRLEGRLALPALLDRFPDLRLADEPHTWRQTFVLRGLEHLPVRA